MRDSIRRIVEHQSHAAIRSITDTQEEYEFIEDLIDETKPRMPTSNHHYLIKKPYSYPPPIPLQYASRFSPTGSNLLGFYGAFDLETCLYEYAYRFMRQRLHLKKVSQSHEPRSAFEVDFDTSGALHIRSNPGVIEIMNRSDYREAHQFAKAHAGVASIIYPSCRDPQSRDCVCVYEINKLGTEPKNIRGLSFVFHYQTKDCSIFDTNLRLLIQKISWAEVSK